MGIKAWSPEENKKLVLEVIKHVQTTGPKWTGIDMNGLGGRSSLSVQRHWERLMKTHRKEIISLAKEVSEENDASLEAFNMYLDQGYFWKPREDEKLRAFVKKHGPNWKHIKDDKVLQTRGAKSASFRWRRLRQSGQSSSPGGANNSSGEGSEDTDATNEDATETAREDRTNAELSPVGVTNSRPKRHGKEAVGILYNTRSLTPSTSGRAFSVYAPPQGPPSSGGAEDSSVESSKDMDSTHAASNSGNGGFYRYHTPTPSTFPDSSELYPRFPQNYRREPVNHPRFSQEYYRAPTNGYLSFIQFTSSASRAGPTTPVSYRTTDPSDIEEGPGTPAYGANRTPQPPRSSYSSIANVDSLSQRSPPPPNRYPVISRQDEKKRLLRSRRMGPPNGYSSTSFGTSTLGAGSIGRVLQGDPQTDTYAALSKFHPRRRHTRGGQFRSISLSHDEPEYE